MLSVSRRLDFGVESCNFRFGFRALDIVFRLRFRHFGFHLRLYKRAVVNLVYGRVRLGRVLRGLNFCVEPCDFRFGLRAFDIVFRLRFRHFGFHLSFDKRAVIRLLRFGLLNLRRLRGLYFGFEFCYFRFRGNSVYFRLRLRSAPLGFHFRPCACKFGFNSRFYKFAVVDMGNGGRGRRSYLRFESCYFRLRLYLIPVGVGLRSVAFGLHFGFRAGNRRFNLRLHIVGVNRRLLCGLRNSLRFELGYLRFRLYAVDFLLGLGFGALGFHFGFGARDFRIDLRPQ